MRPLITRTLTAAILAAALVPTTAAASAGFIPDAGVRGAPTTGQIPVPGGEADAGYSAPAQGGSGFDWGDAAIGGAVALALVGAAGATTAAVRSGRPRATRVGHDGI